jgi:hypothetical protein
MHFRCAQSRIPVNWSWPKDLTLLGSPKTRSVIFSLKIHLISGSLPGLPTWLQNGENIIKTNNIYGRAAEKVSAHHQERRVEEWPDARQAEEAAAAID